MPLMKLEGNGHHYLVDSKDLVMKTGSSRVYLCRQEGTQKECLFQISADESRNNVVMKMAHHLKELKRHSDNLENLYQHQRTDTLDTLNYDLMFPMLVDSFHIPEQGNRKANVLAFKNVPSVTSMIPLGRMLAKDKIRVDMQTSVWIMGKLFKLLDFAHSNGLAIGKVNINNMLIEPDEHYILIFDWSATEVHSGYVPHETAKGEIVAAVKAVISILGGDPKRITIPNYGDPQYEDYTQFLYRLARGGETSAAYCHGKFYKLVDGLWRRGFHPFTWYPLDA